MITVCIDISWVNAGLSLALMYFVFTQSFEKAQSILNLAVPFETVSVRFGLV